MSEGGQSVAERGVPVRGKEDDPGTITTNDLREEGLCCVHIRYLNNQIQCCANLTFGALNLNMQ